MAFSTCLYYRWDCKFLIRRYLYCTMHSLCKAYGNPTSFHRHRRRPCNINVSDSLSRPSASETNNQLFFPRPSFLLQFPSIPCHGVLWGPSNRLKDNLAGRFGRGNNPSHKCKSPPFPSPSDQTVQAAALFIAFTETCANSNQCFLY